jgi:hypothetical protein
MDTKGGAQQNPFTVTLSNRDRGLQLLACNAFARVQQAQRKLKAAGQKHAHPERIRRSEYKRNPFTVSLSNRDRRLQDSSLQRLRQGSTGSPRTEIEGRRPKAQAHAERIRRADHNRTRSR